MAGPGQGPGVRGMKTDVENPGRVFLRQINDVDQNPRAFGVPQELEAEAFPLVRVLDQARQIRNHDFSVIHRENA